MLPQMLPETIFEDAANVRCCHKRLKIVAPRAGIEPATNRLTAGRAAAPYVRRRVESIDTESAAAVFEQITVASRYTGSAFRPLRAPG